MRAAAGHPHPTWNIVVIQEDLPETRVADFKDYARRFVDEVRASGARPVLPMVGLPATRLDLQQQIAEAHREVGRTLNVDVARWDWHGYVPSNSAQGWHCTRTTASIRPSPAPT